MSTKVYILAGRYQIAQEIARNKDLAPQDWKWVSKSDELLGLQEPICIVHSTAQDAEGWPVMQRLLKERRATVLKNSL